MNIQNQNTPDGFSTMDKHDLTDADQARSQLYGLQQGQVWGNSIKQMRKAIWYHLSTGRHKGGNGVFGDVSYFDMFPKTFNIPEGNYDPTALGVGMWELTFASEGPKGSLAELSKDTWTNIYDGLKQFDWRTYFLDKTCAEMISKSHLNDSMDLSEVRFTIPSFAVSIPRGVDITGNLEDPIISLAITRTWTICFTSKDKQHQALNNESLNALGIDIDDVLSLNKRIINEGDGSWKEIRDSWITEFGLDGRDDITLAPVLCVGGVSLKGNNIPLRFPMLDEPIRESLDFLFGLSVEKDKQSQKGVAEALRLNEFAIKLLLFMVAKPDEVDSASKLIKKARERRGKLMNDNKWSACFIGRKYGACMKVQGYGGEKKKKRSHWRQGHFRGVWKGKGRSKYVVVWIDPCYVNDPTTKINSKVKTKTLF